MKQSGKRVKPRVIVHVDMDAFFAAVEQRDRPEIRGKPVVVGADPRGGHGRGVVSTASYEARRFGIHSAQPISQAFRACPQAIFLPSRFDAYKEASLKMMEVLGEFSPILEQVSIDESFLDCSGTELLFGPPRQLGLRIKKRIREELELTCSVGIGSNKFIAKTASDLEKPDGLTICPNGREKQFLRELPIGRLWGIGPTTASQLKRLGHLVVGSLADSNPADLEKLLGQNGRRLWQLANGLDDRPLVTRSQPKSLSEERTFPEDTEDRELIDRTLLGIADRLSRRLRNAGLRAFTLTLKVRLKNFETHTRSRTVRQPVDSTRDLYDFARDALKEFLQNSPREEKKIRLLGIALSRPEIRDEIDPGQPPLFSEIKGRGGATTDSLLDELKLKYGEGVRRASLLPPSADRE